MPCVSSYKLMKTASQEGYAVPAFNIDNLESAIAAAEVMKETKKPLIIQTIPRTLAYGGMSVYPTMMRSLTSGILDVDYSMHLDHGSSKELAEKCINCGFSSVMFDGSSLPYAENIMKTREVADLAMPLGVSVEGELGTIGGKEEGNTDLEASYTKVSEAVEFCELTGVSTLAIGVGTVHGVYKGEPKINIKRIEEIHSAVSTPLVLHGASGLSDEILRDCIKAGISKINFATEIRQAYTEGIKLGMSQNPDVFDPKIYMRVAIDEIKKVMLNKIEVCYIKG